MKRLYLVLIVAKCNVNEQDPGDAEGVGKVLIVAKCNVNSNVRELLKECEGVLIVAKCNVNLKKATASAKATEY